MSEELVFKVSDSVGEYVTMNMEEVTWNTQFGSSSFSPAVLRVLGDLFAGSNGEAQTLPTLIIYFGKFTESVTFTVTIDSDSDFWDFRYFATQKAYFNSDRSTNPLEFYWGGSGDSFYTGENDVANLTKYEGMFQSFVMTRRIPETKWKGTIKFAVGKVIQL
jgi:hypothetical protein